MSGTNKKSKKDWIDIDPDDVENKILELKERGNSISEIGMILRDQYAIPNVREITGKKISKILSEKGKEPKLPEDLRNLIEKAVKLREHIEENPKDRSSKRGLHIIESRIRNLAKYYRKEDRITEDWKYRPEEARLLLSE